MSDMYDALLGTGQVDPQALAEGLRRKEALGTLASMTGIAGLQKLGPQMINQAASGAQDYATLRDRTQNQGLQRALQAFQLTQASGDRKTAEANRLQMHADSVENTRAIAAQADATRRAAIDARAADKEKSVSDKLAADLQKKQEAADNISASYDDIIDRATALRNNPAISRITGAYGKVPNFPGSAAADAEAQLHSLKSQAALSAIQALRAGGGSLGRVTNTEFLALQNSLAPLVQDQSTEGLQHALDALAKHAREAKERIQKAAGGTSAPTALPQSAGRAMPAPGGNPNETPANYSGPQNPYPASNPADNAPAVEPGTAGAVQLTPQEQAELAALRARFGKR